MNRRARSFAPFGAQQGQALVLGMLLAAVVAAALAMLYGLGRTVEARMRLTHVADAVAYSGALEQARQLNLLAYANRTQIAHQVAMAHLVTLGASMAFAGALAGRHRRNNPPTRLLAALFGRDVGLAYRAARADPGGQAELARAYAEHDRIVHQVLEAGMASVVADFPASRERLMRAVLQDNYAAAPAVVPTIRLLSDTWPGYVEHRASAREAGLRSVVEQAVGRYGFLDNRDGTRRNAGPVSTQCPALGHELRRRGSTWLGSDGRWGALDTQSFHPLRANRWAGCYYREYGMGWGTVLGHESKTPSNLEYVENPPENFISQSFWQWVKQSTTWDIHNGSANPLANSYAMAQGGRWPGQGLPDYYELARCCRTESLRFAVALSLDERKRSVLTLSADGFRPAGWLGTLTVTSAAETFFARPHARADGRNELATLFRPYWQARLSSVTPAETLLAREAR